MTDDAETTRVLYFVEPPEQVVLQGLERDILSVLSTNQVEGHATWVRKISVAQWCFCDTLVQEPTCFYFLSCFRTYL
jgi:hypothetical protein